MIDEYNIQKGYKFTIAMDDLSHYRICYIIKFKKHGDIVSTLMSYKREKKVGDMDLSSGCREYTKKVIFQYQD